MNTEKNRDVKTHTKYCQQKTETTQRTGSHIGSDIIGSVPARGLSNVLMHASRMLLHLTQSPSMTSDVMCQILSDFLTVFICSAVRDATSPPANRHRPWSALLDPPSTRSSKSRSNYM